MTGMMASAPRRGGWELFGRDRELAELAASLEDALGGQGRLFLLAGEPGIGKTRLAEQLAERASARGALVVWGRCWEGGGAPPYWPWAQVIRSIAQGCDDRTLASWVGSGAGYLGQMAPELTERLGSSGQGTVPSIESDAARFYLFDATATFLRKAAAAQPLMLVLDDLHAADDPSLLLLRYLARGLRGMPLLVLGTYRDVDVWRSSGIGDALGELVREGQLTTLHGLSRDDVKELIGDLVGAAPSEDVVLAVQDATEGNPLFVREAVRLLASSGALQQPGRPSVPIPGSVRALIQQRLAPLTAGAIGVLSAAAVVGRDFDLSLVGPACELSADRVLAAVSEAVALGIVSEEAVAPGRYRFSHSLMREVIYEALPIPARAGLHRAVGEAIESLYGTEADRHLAELSRHFAEVASAGESARALTYARRAGDRAMQTHAYEEAAAEYRRALRAFDLSRSDADRDASGEDLHSELLLHLGAALVRAGRYPEAKEVHLQAVEIARRLGSHERFARATLGYGQPHVEGGYVNRQLVALLREALDALSPEDSPLRARLLARLSVELTFSDEVHLTDGLSREAVGMARRLDDVTALGAALDARWMAVWGPDGSTERAELADEILRLALATGDRDLEMVGRSQRVTASLESGDALAVASDIATYGRIADELRMPVHQWTATSMRAMRALLQGEFEAAERIAAEARDHQPERQNARWAYIMELSFLRWEQGRLDECRAIWEPTVERFPRLAIARSWVALADLERGDRASAHRALKLLADQLPTYPHSGLWLPGYALASLLAGQIGDPEAANLMYSGLRPYADRVIAMNMEQPVVSFGSAHLYLGILAATARRWADAVPHFEAATRLHERLDAAPLLARTRYEYARMLLGQGEAADCAQALGLLERAGVAATTIGQTVLIGQIAELQAAGISEAAPAPAQIASAAVAPTPVVPDQPLPPPTPEAERFQREGEFWTVSYDGQVVRLKDSKGLRQIALLLAQPGRELHATDLERLVGGSTDGNAPPANARMNHGEVALRPDFGDAGELLDAEARTAYKARLDELQEDIEEAEEFNDPERAEKARGEREFLIRELARAVGLGGRDRKAASHAERARLNATRAIRAAMTNLAREHPSLGRHLTATIRTGRYCSYTPDPRTPVSWHL